MRQLPLEDVGAVLITAPACKIQSYFLSQAAQGHIPVVICENYRPVSVFLPIQRSVDTLLTRAQVGSSARLRHQLWLKTVGAKCTNQCGVLADLGEGEGETVRQMRELCGRKTDSVEGACAHLYWSACSRILGIEAFSRIPAENEGLNSLLNYAYAMLLTATLQALLCCGLDPLYGIGHVVRERSTPLAYDVMEPFRPLVDLWVFTWLKHCRDTGVLPEVNKSYKQFLRRCMQQGTSDNTELREIILLSVKGLRDAFLGKGIQVYQPWQWRTTKWAGSLSALISP